MSEDQKLTIYFVNGAVMEVAFPKQIKNSPGAVLEAMKRLLEADKLAMEADGKLIVIPWSSIQHVEADAAPSALPFGAIRGAQIRRLDPAK